MVGIGQALFITLFAIPFALGELLGLTLLAKSTSLSMVVYDFICAVTHVVFRYLLRAPTLSGRRLMDQVEGFKLFLSEVHGDSLNRAMPPQQTPEVFERFLPYALALDVEQQWAEKFSSLLASAGGTKRKLCTWIRPVLLFREFLELI